MSVLYTVYSIVVCGLKFKKLFAYHLLCINSDCIIWFLTFVFYLHNNVQDNPKFLQPHTFLQILYIHFINSLEETAISRLSGHLFFMINCIITIPICLEEVCILHTRLFIAKFVQLGKYYANCVVLVPLVEKTCSRPRFLSQAFLVLHHWHLSCWTSKQSYCKFF